jgi:DNA-binding ferritin-like protein (Dps family)
LVNCVALLLEEANVLEKTGLDVVVEQELGKDVELFLEELIREVDLETSEKKETKKNKISKSASKS